MPVPGIRKVQYLFLWTVRVHEMKPGSGETPQPIPLLLKLIRKKPRLILRRKMNPMMYPTFNEFRFFWNGLIGPSPSRPEYRCRRQVRYRSSRRCHHMPRHLSHRGLPHCRSRSLHPCSYSRRRNLASHFRD